MALTDVTMLIRYHNDLPIIYFHFVYFCILGLFSAFEQKSDGGNSKADSLGIKSYGVSMTTLEEVFLKLGTSEDCIFS